MKLIRPLLLILFVTLSQSSLSKSFNWNFYKNEKGKCEALVLFYTSSDKSTYEGVRINPSSLEYKYCDSLFKKNYSSKYYFKTAEHGLPSETLISLDTVFANSISEELANSADWEEILDLNKVAKIIWDQMISYIGVEGARYEYFNSKRFLRNKKENKALIKELNEFKESISLFLLSSSVYQVKKGSALLNYHPLFIQILIELYTNEMNFDASSKGQKNNYFVKESISELLNGNSSSVSKVEYSSFVLRRINLINLLNLIFTENQCESFGLRPELSRSIVQGSSSLKIKDQRDIVKYIHEIGKYVDSLKSVSVKKCGKVNSSYRIGSSPFFPIYATSFSGVEKVIKKYRELSKVNY